MSTYSNNKERERERERELDRGITRMRYMHLSKVDNKLLHITNEVNKICRNNKHN